MPHNLVDLVQIEQAQSRDVFPKIASASATSVWSFASCAYFGPGDGGGSCVTPVPLPTTVMLARTRSSAVQMASTVCLRFAHAELTGYFSWLMSTLDKRGKRALTPPALSVHHISVPSIPTLARSIPCNHRDN